MAQMIEHLPSKHKALSSNPSMEKKNFKGRNPRKTLGLTGQFTKLKTVSSRDILLSLLLLF
jgi:hypothetical protein